MCPYTGKAARDEREENILGRTMMRVCKETAAGGLREHFH
jgi:hypothetical protein